MDGRRLGGEPPAPGTVPPAADEAFGNSRTEANQGPSVHAEATQGEQGASAAGSRLPGGMPARIENALQQVEQQLAQLPELAAGRQSSVPASVKSPQEAGGPSGPESQKLLLRVVQAMRQAAQRRGVVRMKLHPPELGSVQLQLRLRRGGVEAELRVESSQAQQALLENLHQLRQRLAEQDVKILRFEVDLMNQPPGHFADRQEGGDQRAPAPRSYTGPGTRAGIETEPGTPGPSQILGADRVDVVV